jgi:hypothetical protein
MQFPVERSKSSQMPSVFHTTTCALVGETIPAANDALLPPACPGFRPTTAQAAWNYYCYYYYYYFLQILKIKNDLKIKVSWVSLGIVEYNLIKRFNFFQNKSPSNNKYLEFLRIFYFQTEILKLINSGIFAI